MSISDITASMATFKARLQGAEGVTIGNPDEKVREISVKCSVPSKTSYENVTEVDDERCRFRQAWQRGLADTRRERGARAT